MFKTKKIKFIFKMPKNLKVRTVKSMKTKHREIIEVLKVSRSLQSELKKDMIAAEALLRHWGNYPYQGFSVIRDWD